MKGLPIGMQYFKEIIVNNYLYVDKTEFILKNYLSDSSIFSIVLSTQFIHILDAFFNLYFFYLKLLLIPKI